MALTEKMQKELAGLARAANRRIERATEGQRNALEYYLRGYHTRKRDNGMIVFQQGKAKTEREYKARMKELKRFMEGDPEEKDEGYKPISTRAGWEKLKKENVSKAAETLRNAGNDITDEELEMILIEGADEDIGGSDPVMLAAVQNVQIAKAEAGESWTPSPEAIRKAIEERRSDQERVEQLIKTRKAAERKIRSLVSEARKKRRS